MKPRSLATQLLLFILPATALVFLALFLTTYSASKQAVLREVAEDARNLTQATVYQIVSVLHGIEKVPDNLPPTLSQYSQTCPAVESLIRRSLIQNPEIYGIAVAFEPHSLKPRDYYCCPYGYRHNGRIELRNLGGGSYHYFSRDWYQLPKELQRPLWSEPYYDEGGGDIIMATYSVPFYQGEGAARKFWGVVTADVSLFWLQEMVAAVKIYNTGFAFLISHSGVFVTAPAPRLIMRESIFSLAEARGDAQLRQIGRDMIAGKEGFVALNSFVNDKKSWLYYAPLGATGWSLGVIFPEDELLASVNALGRTLAGVSVLGLGILVLVIIILARTQTRPLRRLEQTAAVLGQGDFTVTVPETGTREIAHLAYAFNDLGRQLTEYIAKRDFIRDTFGRYVTQEVVKKLLESREALELGGETREITILMSDLRGFTAITAQMEPEQVISFLNRYLGKMIEILLDHHAVIDEIIGDGILAFFGAPEHLDNHSEQAVVCALRMQAAMADINTANEADGFPYLEMGIAVNTGTVVVGNIGSEKRTKYSAVGSPVNFTGRMEAFSVGGQVLISPSTYARVETLVRVRDVLEVEMKGVADKNRLYDVQGLGPPYDIMLPDRQTEVTPLDLPLSVLIHHVRDKIVTGAGVAARITHISQTAARLESPEALPVWENIRLEVQDAVGAALPGKIYGKVVAAEPAGDSGWLLEARFTSVSPEIYQFIRRTTAGP